MSSLLKQFLGELGKNLNLNLDLNKVNACVTKLAHGTSVRIELDTKQENMIIGSIIGSVPHGSYREELFQRALQSNGLPPPHYGVFGWSKKGDYLILYEMIPVKEYNAQRVAELMEPFAEKAKIWRDAIENAVIPILEKSEKGKGRTGGLGKLFGGIKPF